jgi:signal peptide peptidase SppA
MSDETRMPQYPRIAARVFDTPLLIEASKLNAILHVLGPRLGFDAPQMGDQLPYQPPATHEAALQRHRAERRDEGHMVVEGGVAVIPVLGTLVQRSGWMDSFSGMVGYDRVERMFAAALDDSAVREIILEIDSPGGEVAGAFDLADKIQAERGRKPVTAIASELSASAAYLIASAADEIVVPRTGMVGSVGVVMAHYDYSKALEKRGVAVTLIYAGDHKVDGNPFEPLPADVRKDMQAEIDSIYRLFVDTVARNLNIGVDRVRGTQAGMFMGQNAVDIGLAHRVGTFSEEIGSAVSRRAGPFRLDTQRRESTMSDQKQGNGGPVITAEDVAAARAEAHAAGVKEGSAAAVASERERIKAIVTHAEAQGRTELAAELAFGTDMAADKAAALLAKSPKASAQSPLDMAMQREGGAPVMNQPASQPPASAPVVNANAIFAARKAAAQGKR